MATLSLLPACNLLTDVNHFDGCQANCGEAGPQDADAAMRIADGALATDADPDEASVCTDGRTCDDHQACTANVCTPTGCEFPLLQDNDGDGFVPSAFGLACATDCDDGDPKVHPGQTQFFTFHSELAEFDYDCNGIQEKRFTTVAVCQDGPSGCKFTEGWLEKVAGCGVTAKWVTQCVELSGKGTCGVPAGGMINKVQECR